MDQSQAGFFFNTHLKTSVRSGLRAEGSGHLPRAPSPQPRAAWGFELASRRRGQSSIETALLIGAAVSALVAMNLYVQRGYQGYLYANASSHGQQFDPRQPHEQNDELINLTQIQDIDIISGTTTVDLPSKSTPVDGIVQAFFNDGGAGAPGGFLQGRALQTKTRIDTSWDLRRNGRFESH